MLGDDRGCLPKRQSNRNMLNGEVKSQRGLDRDQIRSVFLQLEQFHGVRLAYWFRVIVFVVFRWMEKHISDDFIDNCRLGDNKQQAIFVPVKESVNAICLFLVEISFFVLMREHLVFFPIISMLGLQVAFVAFGSERELKQLRVVCSLPLHARALTFLTPDVHAEQALDRCGSAIWRSLDRHETIFFRMLLPDGRLEAHDAAKTTRRHSKI
jgi:hypothetical protein